MFFLIFFFMYWSTWWYTMMTRPRCSTKPKWSATNAVQTSLILNLMLLGNRTITHELCNQKLILWLCDCAITHELCNQKKILWLSMTRVEVDVFTNCERVTFHIFINMEYYKQWLYMNCITILQRNEMWMLTNFILLCYIVWCWHWYYVTIYLAPMYIFLNLEHQIFPGEEVINITFLLYFYISSTIVLINWFCYTKCKVCKWFHIIVILDKRYASLT